MLLNPNNFSNLNLNCYNLLDMRNLHEQVKKAFCYQKLFWPFTVWINCSSDLKTFSNSRQLKFEANFKSFFLITRTIFSHSRSEQFIIINKIPFLAQFQIFKIVREKTLKCSRPISSSGNKKILLTTRNVRLNRGHYATNT